MELSLKLKMLKLEYKYTNEMIARFTGASLSSVFNWTSDKYKPKKIQKRHARKLMELFNNKVTMKDCGY